METSRSSIVRQIPNCITALRIVATAALLFVQPMSQVFFIIYTLAGLTDALDGWLARKLHVMSDFGSKLDSAADLIFYAIMFILIFPALWAALPRVIWLGVATVVLLRLVSYGVAAVKFRRFASTHSILNKLTGAAVFALPYIARTTITTPYCWGLFALSLTGTLQELIKHTTKKEYTT